MLRFEQRNKLAELGYQEIWSLARCNAGQRLSAQMNGFLQQRSPASSAG
jgi:hypothetical protein